MITVQDLTSYTILGAFEGSIIGVYLIAKMRDPDKDILDAIQAFVLILGIIALDLILVILLKEKPEDDI